ncbi:uncharacterized protein LOC127810887 [Diospyros lotus]|uniref:uncharacterized protein LOC127810887 n=1 Tax=Diospyros lotus TaxID=55363 RepID=UPI00225554F1|nr:uncharacterized protein LOC127810887 [Diospyros lotus]
MALAADVGALLRMMKEGQTAKNDDQTALITRDLLGGCYALETKELDLELQVPSGWEKRLDLKTGKVYLQRCSSSDTSSFSSDHNHQSNGTVPKLQDLNFPPPSKLPLNLFDETSLDLKLVSSSSPANYQSVCTLDKVKSALERAEKEETTRKRSMPMAKSLSPSSNSSSSINASGMEYKEKSFSSFAAGCPRCLLYVLISRNNPKCPHCNTIVPSPVEMKKPRIDLNISI